jgi:hypothetical protein
MDMQLYLGVANLIIQFAAYALFRETLNKLVCCVVRQAHHERNQLLAVRPELVEGLVQRFLRGKIYLHAARFVKCSNRPSLQAFVPSREAFPSHHLSGGRYLFCSLRQETSKN